LEKYYKEHEGQKVTITIEPGDQTRSIAQNNFFHGPLINAFIRATGTASPGWWKAFLKKTFLSRQVVDSNGKNSVLSIRGTSGLSVAGFSNFIEQCIQYLIDECGGHLTQAEQHDYKETL
jgi:hypothetical protein